MACVNCNVNTCSYNENCSCHAPNIQVGGKGACDCGDTCCGTYMNQAAYSNVAQYTNNRSDNQIILCRVDTCTHYSDERCTLSTIQIGSPEKADTYSETECDSFEQK